MSQGPESISRPAATFGEVITAGTEVDQVEVEIDYAIISHFSKHLYSSPNKAIEELVSNGFDAFAEKVNVYIPGKYLKDKVVVWDNGVSMDSGGLKRLWWIARSPKDDGDQRVFTEGGRTRSMIGKFGIGKLACYAIGDRVTHLCKRGGKYLSVSVDYRDVPKLDDDQTSHKYVTPVRELTEAEARAAIEAAFDGEDSASAMEMFDDAHWTIAFIDSFRDSIRLTPGRLRWVISNGMPLRPDFRVWVDDTEVVAKLEGKAAITWNMSATELQSAIRSAWSEAVTHGNVTGEVEYGTDENGEPTAILPVLGEVRATVRLFGESLRTSDDDEADRSYGFFVLVRDRLLNPDDAVLYLQPPSYGTFYRCQYVIHADGLDPVLLADREHLIGDSPHRRELALIQRALYLASRSAIEDQDATKEHEERSESLLPTGSRDHYRGPLSTLLSHEGSPPDSKVLTEPRIDRVGLDAESPLASISEDREAFQVNTAHPFVKAIQETLGTGKKAREILRTIDVLAVSEKLLEGYLLDIGIADEQVEKIMTWRDGLLRTMGLRLRENPEELERTLMETSYSGKQPFENAIADIFRAMGFVANRDGLPGQKDVLAVAPIGKTSYSFSVEAKGSSEALPNDQADVANAAAHRDAVQADFVLIVAREFVGFKQSGNEAQILKDCAAAGGSVAIMTVEALVELYRVNRRLALPLDLIPDVLKVLESPAEKLEKIRAIASPTTTFDWRSLLSTLWGLQQGQAQGDVVPYRSVWQNDWREIMEFDDFTLKLTALEAMAGGLISVDTTREHVTLRQSPDNIADRITAEETAAETDNPAQDG